MTLKIIEKQEKIVKSLEVLLLKDVPKLGKKGKIVKVKAGYGRNYLIPKKLAAIATKENIRLLEIEKKRSEQLELARKEQIRQLASELEKTPCTIEAKTNEEGHLFGSVTYSLIAEAFNNLGFDIKAQDIELEKPEHYPIKERGIFHIHIRLHPEIVAKSKVWVVDEQSGE